MGLGLELVQPGSEQPVNIAGETCYVSMRYSSYHTLVDAVDGVLPSLLNERERAMEAPDYDWENDVDYEAVAKIFTEHSDCEGRLTTDECGDLVLLFEKILPFLVKGSYAEGKLPELLELFRTAAETGCDVLYC